MGRADDGRFPDRRVAVENRLHLGRAELRGGGGGLYRFDETRWQARRIVARGSASGVQVGLILDPTTRAVKSRGDSLQVGGEWDVDIAEQVNGVGRFFREKGDLVLQGASPVQLVGADVRPAVKAVSFPAWWTDPFARGS